MQAHKNPDKNQYPQAPPSRGPSTGLSSRSAAEMCNLRLGFQGVSDLGVLDVYVFLGFRAKDRKKA